MPQPRALRPQLKPHQVGALQWMLSREMDVCAVPGLECVWRQVPCADGAMYWNPTNGAIARHPPPPTAAAAVRGGLLADEMGLGKTVDALALILTHRWDGAAAVVEAGAAPAAEADAALEADAEDGDALGCVCGGTPRDFNGAWVGCDACGRWVHATCAGFADAEEAASAGAYTCAACACAAEQKPCGATLLVCPAALLGQWRGEVAAHVDEGCVLLLPWHGCCSWCGAAAGVVPWPSGV